MAQNCTREIASVANSMACGWPSGWHEFISLKHHAHQASDFRTDRPRQYQPGLSTLATPSGSGRWSTAHCCWGPGYRLLPRGQKSAQTSKRLSQWLPQAKDCPPQHQQDRHQPQVAPGPAWGEAAVAGGKVRSCQSRRMVKPVNNATSPHHRAMGSHCHGPN